MKEVFHLVYVSKAAENISYSDIRNILEASRRNNGIEDITGLLILRDGYFLQLLEGPESGVKKILGKIMMDDRNYNLHVLIQAFGDERLFHDWTMAFYDGDIAANSTEDLVNLFEYCVSGTGEQRPLILPMLRQFRASAPEFK